jgi:hypothetical protein
MLIEIDADRFEAELIQPGKAVLLACFLDSPLEADHAVDVREAAWRLNGRVAVVKPSDKDWEIFRAKWWIGGTPTYILFLDGKEAARKRGRADALELVEFVTSVIGQDPGT